MRCPRAPYPARLFIPAILMTGLSCSTEARSRLVHFFFEVPSPRASAPDERPPSQVMPPASPRVSAARPFASIHLPFRERRCGECHDSSSAQAILEPWAERCAKCHQSIFYSGPVLHGPVGAIACDECHLPHASPLPALLRQMEPDLCLACHAPTLVRNDDHHADVSGSCTRCHDPHGGADYRLLRPNYSQQAADSDAGSAARSGGSTR